MNKLTSMWLALNDKIITNILRELEINDLKESYGEINLREIIRIIKGAKEEINILSRKVERLESELEDEKRKK